MTTNKRTSSSLMTDDSEAKKVKIESLNSTTPSFVDENISNKNLCKYGENCYRQNNPIHTAEYDHPCIFERDDSTNSDIFFSFECSEEMFDTN